VIRNVEEIVDQRYGALKQTLATKVDDLWAKVSWNTPRDEADRIKWDAIQACHAFHRAANPAYRERCEREEFWGALEPEHLPSTAFPEEIYKAYSQKTRGNGNALGVFCERDVPLLLEHLNHYVVRPLTMEGLSESYARFTDINGGLDRLRADLLEAQGVILVTSSGTTGKAVSLIPLDQASLNTLSRSYGRLFRHATIVPGRGPIEQDCHCLVGYSPRAGSMMMALAFQVQAKGFEERAFLTIPADVQTRELRWRGRVYSGAFGRMVGWMMQPLIAIGGKRTSRKGLENTIEALREAEKLGVRTAVAGNPWMAYNSLKEMEELLQAEIREGRKRPGDSLVDLAPGSVLVFGGGNKSGLNVSEEEIVALYRKVISGIDRVVDVYNQSEGYVSGIRCAEGHYHLDPHAAYFVIDSYLAYYDPRQNFRVPATITGDLVDKIIEEPCPCGAPTRFFRSIRRDDVNRGSKGCAAALAEYA
jgi:hypothetical protein